MSTVIVEDQPGQDHEEEARLERIKKKPDVSECFNLLDFEAVARQVMKKTAWAYYSSGADDEITLRENHHAFQRIWFRPRILTNVGNVDYSTTMLGAKVSMPIYITATALGKLGHPDGETVLTRAARTHNIIQMIPTLASCSFDEIRNAAEEGQVQWMQLYVNKDREITKRYVQHGEKRGIRGLFITVDAPQLGRREKDMRSKYNESAAKVQTNETKLDRSQGAARAISSFIDPSLCWDDIEWFRSITKMPIILKGVQRHEDALKAVEYGLQGVVLSNHGGRQLDFARSGIEILVEVMDALKKKGWEKKLEVYVDGGVRRGTDIIKAVCLGARGVGIGRPFLYAMSAYGQPGVEKAIQRFVLSNPNLMVVLKDEMEMNMRLIGARTLDELDQSFVDTRALSTHIGISPF